MMDMLADQWSALILGVLAATFNMYSIEAQSRGYDMGTIIYKYKDVIELVNWLILLGVIIYLSYQYTWWFVASFWVFPLVGAIIAGLLRGIKQIVYIFGMPIFMVAAVLSFIQNKA